MTVFQVVAPGLPADTPWGIVVLFMMAAGVGGWFAAQVWPSWRMERELRLKAELETKAAEREQIAAERRQLYEERRADERERLKAWQTIAHWSEKTGEALIAVSLRLDSIDRKLGNELPPRPLQAKARGMTEGEREDQRR